MIHKVPRETWKDGHKSRVKIISPFYALGDVRQNKALNSTKKTHVYKYDKHYTVENVIMFVQK